MKKIRKVFDIILNVAYFLILIGLFLLIFARDFISSKIYSNVLENTDLESVKVSDLGGIINKSQYVDDATLEDVFVSLFTKEDVEEEKVKALVNDKKIKQMVGEIAGDVINYTKGGKKPYVSKKEVKKLFENQVVVDVAGDPTDENIGYVYNQINNLIEEVASKY